MIEILFLLLFFWFSELGTRGPLGWGQVLGFRLLSNQYDLTYKLVVVGYILLGYYKFLKSLSRGQCLNTSLGVGAVRDLFPVRL